MGRHVKETPARPARRTLDDLLARARAGDSEAAQELFSKHAKHFLRGIRHKLARRLRTIFDSKDFMQETRIELHTSKFLEACSSVDAFLAFLTSIAENQVLEANRKYLDYQRHNLNREVPLDTVSGNEQEPAARQASASEVLIEKEEWERLLQGQPLLYRQMAELIRQGYTQREVASLFHVHEKTVHRAIAKIMEKHLRGAP